MNIQRHLWVVAAGVALSAAAHAQSATPSGGSSGSLQMYGVIDAYAGTKQLASASGAKTTNVDAGGMTTSLWGFRGAEDLGSGLLAVFDISGFIRNDTGDVGRFTGDTFFSRTTYVGLQAPWGTLRLGRITTPNFISTVRLNPFGDSTVFGPVLLHTYIGGQPLDASIASGGAAGISDSAHNNAIAYTTPTANGFVGAITYSLGEASGSNANGRLGYSLTYDQGPLLASFSGERVDRPTLPPPPAVPAGNQKQRQNTNQLGAAYNFGVFKLFGQYSVTGIDLPAASRNFKTTQLGVSVPTGGLGKVLFSVAQTRKTETALADVKRTTASLGYDYDLSKRTDLYAVVMRDSVTSLQSGTTFAVGIRHKF